MGLLNSLDVQNILSNLMGCTDLFGSKQESSALQALTLFKNSSDAIQIAVNVFTIGGVVSLLETPIEQRQEAKQKLHSRLEMLVPFLEKLVLQEAKLHSVVYEHMRTVNTLPFAIGALSAIQAKVDLLATNAADDKDLIAEFFSCPMPEYTASDLLIALLDELQREHHICDNEWQNMPFMPFESLLA